MKTISKIIIAVSLLVVIIFVFGVYWVIYLNIAHSTFDNYYKFRGCNQLINKTDTYGFCSLGSGQVIKIVKYNNKWYLEGDLPVNCGFGISCP